ncbi:TIGR03862 family flavoprotein [Stappia sp.]|jgi:uncharacterized flavoprotein (TIGR03862 family)|uniref:NAD(P)/FAD-dependent oxidoreductase n=1 Tax=Stappia sp. TaxID=1870903 RepID=UPI0026C41B0B
MNMPENRDAPTVAIVGAGPAGLIAADLLSARGARVTIYERMPSVARKLLMAGRGGLNLTHSEDRETFHARYREAEPLLAPMLDAFSPAELIAWCKDLGIETFTGTSGRVFPRALKASPLVRALLARLGTRGVTIRTRWRLVGLEGDSLAFETPDGRLELPRPDAVLLALGGASWPRLGSDGTWRDLLAPQGVALSPLRPANAGVTVAWSDFFRQRFAGVPLKRIVVSAAGETVSGEAMVSASGLEGGAIYALFSGIREMLVRGERVSLTVDLRPDLSLEELSRRLSAPRGKRSLSTHLRKAAGLPPVAVALLSEFSPRPGEPAELAGRIKALDIPVTGHAGMERAISSAGGVAFDAVDDDLMLKAMPGTFVAGEMLDWEAPTGGYLLQASFATGARAATAIAHRLGI